MDEKNQFLLVRNRKYQGKTIDLSNGQIIRKGDLITEIHLNNEILFQMSLRSRTELQLAIRMIRAIEELLPKVAVYMKQQLKYQDNKGLYGISMIYRGTEQLGFHVIDMPKNLLFFMTRFYLRMLLTVLHPEGSKRNHFKAELLVPKIIVMPTEELLSSVSRVPVTTRNMSNNM